MTAKDVRTLRRGVTAAALAGALTTTACSAGLDSLPLPAPSVGAHTYTITAEFANALNLPTKAKVKLQGADIGEVEQMHAHDFTAVVSLRIRSGVQLPVGTTAELRSATPMGDVFVALTTPAATGSALLHDGSVIPEPATSDAATIEAVLSRAALLVNGGAVRDLAKVVNGLGADLDGRGNRLADLISQTSTLVRTLSQRSDQIQAAIRDTGTLTDTIAAQQSTVNAAVAAAGPAVRAVSGNTQNIVDLAARLSRIAGELQKFPSVNGTGKRSLITDMNNLSAGLNAAAEQPGLDLNVLNASIGIVGGKVASSTGAGADADVTKIAVGAAPDPNFPGNPDARIPDGTDWANFVGSLAYTLQRLHDRVIGPGR
ncbi:MlaD family protein [Nocardia sp. CA2R105]|uniref:MlaD family protein n=1 Tax=Nocardia coffeae TaxID=2873381 RepID=UPI001CA65DC1|nr:MlaD family protein [Nocardia coffeae]MBY8857065.1 MlaD family protein [Nocardia coffeae]